MTLLITAGHFYYNEYIFPDANKKKLEIKKFTIERRSRTAQFQVRDIKRQIRPGSFYLLSNFDVERRIGNGFKLYETNKNQVKEIVTADRLVYVDYRWNAIDGVRRTFEDGISESFTEFDTLVIDDIKDKPADLAKQLGKPDDMSLDELKHYIDLMKRTGGKYTKESVDLKLKYSFPMASLIVVLVCIPFAANPRRGGIAVSFAVGALIALVYFVLFRVTQSAGYNGKIPEDVAAWAVNGLFFIVGVIAMVKARK
jgi:lipopolysaccharide export system permease protein